MFAANGASALQRPRARARKASTGVNALFKKKAPPPPPPQAPKKSRFSFGAKKSSPPPPPTPAKKSRFGFGAERTSSPAPPKQQQVRDFEYNAQESMSESYARIRKQRARRKAEFEAKEKGGLSAAIFSVTRALDFQEDISADRGLLARAKSMQKGDKMSKEEYGALRRKVGGTKGGFFGESVDVKGKYVEAGYVDAESELVGDLAYAPFLGLVVFAVLATTVWVAAQVP